MTSVTFAKFHPNLIVGGTYSGQIVLWDNRSSKKTPVQRTPLSATAHTVSEIVKVLWRSTVYGASIQSIALVLACVQLAEFSRVSSNVSNARGGKKAARHEMNG